MPLPVDQLPATSSEAVPLTQAATGIVLKVCRLDVVGSDLVRLKRMGICEDRQVRLVQAGDPLILQVVGCRVGLSRRLAGRVFVVPCSFCQDADSGRKG